MKATIWHNPKCSKSRETLALLEAAPGIEITIIHYLETPPSRDELARLFLRARLFPRQALREVEKDAAGLLQADDDTILDAMARSPILIERPLVETDKGVRLCRPPERVREIL